MRLRYDWDDGVYVGERHRIPGAVFEAAVVAAATGGMNTELARDLLGDEAVWEESRSRSVSESVLATNRVVAQQRSSGSGRRHEAVAVLLQCLPLLGPAVLGICRAGFGSTPFVGPFSFLAATVAGWGWGYVYLHKWRRYFATLVLAFAAWMLAGAGVLLALSSTSFGSGSSNPPGILAGVLLTLLPGLGLVLVTGADAWRLVGDQNRRQQ